MGKFYTYIIQSLKDDSFYIGYSIDLEKRILFHNNKLSKYTSTRTPWKIVYFEEFENKSDAIKREKIAAHVSVPSTARSPTCVDD